MNHLCWKCGAKWGAITELIYSDGYDRELGIHIINNCMVCQEHFDYVLSIYLTLDIALVKGGMENGNLITEEVYR